MQVKELIGSAALVTLWACTPAAPRLSVAPQQCRDVLRRPLWALPASGERILKVALIAGDESRDGWRLDGPQRLRDAAAAWNELDVPLRLATTARVDSADIRVVILASLPVDSTSSSDLARYRAGLTRLSVSTSSEIARAWVGIAQSSPRGTPYSVEDQVATLLHELGHAIGLPHSDAGLSMMAAMPVATSLTRMDARLARDTYARAACPRSVATR